MKHKTTLSKLACLLLASPLVLAFLIGPTTVNAEGLTPDDCMKCHEQPPKDIASNGASHKTEINCIDCHDGHPPTDSDIIPECNKCHEGIPHFELKNCLSCHTNPHTPLIISIGSNITEPCLTCHTDQMAQLQQHESKHTQVNCSTCHRDKHGMIPDCMQCHSPHSKELVQKDCLNCHKPHMPLQVSYPEDIASSICGSCHSGVVTMLEASPAKHSKLNCATCHQEKHKMIPQCTSCHGLPHPETMHEKFPKCGQCHGIAHDLNR